MNLDLTELREDITGLIADGHAFPPIANEGILTLIARIEELEAAIQRVRELHQRSYAVFSWKDGVVHYDEPCPECDGKAGVHECGCWADQQIEYVCAECHRLGSKSSGIYDYTWPCPTIKALEGDPNACLHARP